MLRPVAAVLALTLALPALAAEPKPPPVDSTPPATAEGVAAAKSVVTEYLTAVQKKKWAAAKKAIHPKRLEEIADEKKRTGVESHILAPWAHVKESYLTKFTIVDAAPSGHGAVVVSTSHDDYSVEDQGEEEGVKAEFLVAPLAGRWYIVDERLGTGEFRPETVGLSYRGYFDGEYVPPPPAKKKHRR